MNALSLNKLEKNYPGFTLGPLDLDIEPGTVVGYVGPNGSGKTTTMHCITGLVKSDGGHAEIFSRENDPERPEWKRDVGYVGDVHPFFENWPGAKNLKFLSQFFPAWSDGAVMDLSRRFDLDLDKPVKSLSTGNRVKLSLVSVLCRSPRLLLLDEPTSGLDPVVRAEVLDVLFEIIENGESAILYSTHILSDISRIADELVFLRNGTIRQRSAKDDLIESWRKISFRYSGNSINIPHAVSHRHEGDDHLLISSSAKDSLRELSNLGAQDVRETRMSFDEIAVEILKGRGNE